jgi:hypothetical protein
MAGTAWRAVNQHGELDAPRPSPDLSLMANILPRPMPATRKAIASSIKTNRVSAVLSPVMMVPFQTTATEK